MAGRKEDQPWSRQLLGTLIYDHFKMDIDSDPLEPIELIIFENKKLTIQVTSSLKLELAGCGVTQFIRVKAIEDGQIKADENLDRGDLRLPFFIPERFRRRR